MPTSPVHRIALVGSLPFGGSTIFACNLAGELARRGVPTLVVSPDRANGFARDFAEAGVQVALHDDRRFIYEDRMASMLTVLAEFEATVVIGCLGGPSYDVLRYVPQGVYRVALIQTDNPVFYGAVGPYVRHLDLLVGVSRTIKARLDSMAEFQNVRKLTLMYGVKTPKRVEARGRVGGPLRILYLGRITIPQKRVNLFPQILARLVEAKIPFEWTIVGEGDYRAELERTMRSASANQRVTFRGALSNSEVPALLEQQDIFLLASDFEGLPLSLLEAMAHGVAPVISDLESGIPEVVDARTGILVAVDDIEGYSRGIIRLHTHRDELAAKSVAAHERVKEEFSIEAMTERWLEALPAQPGPIGPWPKTWRVEGPLGAKSPFYFSRPVRALRRMLIKLRNNRGATT